MFLRIFDLQDTRACLRWEHHTRQTAACWDPPREPMPAVRTKRAKKQCVHPAPAPANARPAPAAPQDADEDFVHVAHAQQEEMHDFELV